MPLLQRRLKQRIPQRKPQRQRKPTPKKLNIKSGNRIVNIVYVTTDANLAKTVMDMFTKAE